MKVPNQPENPEIQLVETTSGEVTLAIDGGQAMQAWELELMHETADILCTYGSVFLEVGLGLGLSALRIASNPGTKRHVVVEKYPRVTELFMNAIRRSRDRSRLCMQTFSRTCSQSLRRVSMGFSSIRLCHRRFGMTLGCGMHSSRHWYGHYVPEEHLSHSSRRARNCVGSSYASSTG
jgi:hypothetical protein